MPSKKKYTWRHEPDQWKNVSQRKNIGTGGKGGDRTGKRLVPKGIVHPIGFSGRTLSLKKGKH